MMLKKKGPIIAVMLSAMLLMACREKNLLENLTQEQANQVMGILAENNIPVKKSGSVKTGYNLSVEQNDMASALTIVSKYQLPWPSDVEIAQAFPDSALVNSPAAEQTRITSFREQRLGQSLRIIDAVVNARVHISYPKAENSFDEKVEVPHVSVLITYKGNLNEELFISQIKSFIRNSMEELRYENISVILFPAPPRLSGRVTSETSESTDVLAFAAAATLLMAFSALGLVLSKKLPLRRKKKNQTEKEGTENDKQSVA